MHLGTDTDNELSRVWVVRFLPACRTEPEVVVLDEFTERLVQFPD